MVNRETERAQWEREATGTPQYIDIVQANGDVIIYDLDNADAWVSSSYHVTVGAGDTTDA